MLSKLGHILFLSKYHLTIVAITYVEKFGCNMRVTDHINAISFFVVLNDARKALNKYENAIEIIF